jgi:hypothetical protein
VVNRAGRPVTVRKRLQILLKILLYDNGIELVESKTILADSPIQQAADSKMGRDPILQALL